MVVVKGKQEDNRYCFNLAVQGALSEKPSLLKSSSIVAVVEKSKAIGQTTTKRMNFPRRKGKNEKNSNHNMVVP